jgi:GNAT superfamily N-acetyltransferase
MHDDVMLLERHYVEAFAAEAVVPGVEVHCDRDVTWLVHTGVAWRNAGVMLRFAESSAARRLDSLVRRYERHGRGMGFWVSPLATPQNLGQLLSSRGLRCRKHFPAMIRRLEKSDRSDSPSFTIELRRVVDASEFVKIPHPAIGRITTTIRRAELRRLATLVAQPSSRTRAFVAWIDDKPVGAIELFIDGDCAGVHGLDVLSDYQGRGIGSALLERACQEAAASRCKSVVLIATTEGQRLYERRGFTEFARFGYWYRSFQR